ncbi:SigE family RNA polymerase sigma factor [Streptomyces sp. NPDC047009]|uniref:SigE family RNA polymerase sigma factor n=1 Tax=Streptomyces sp. NPDC047009 TaxID=3154496 RepID=UPI0033F9B906
MDAEQEFTEFVHATQLRLRRTAYLLCGDWHLAEDLVQATFIKLFRYWRRARNADSIEAYARRTLTRIFLDHHRKWTAIPTDNLPEQAPEPSPGDLRLTVLEALAELPPKSRSVVVLRYWEDMSVEETAKALGISTGTVKSQSSKGLAKLRQRLQDHAFARPA